MKKKKDLTTIVNDTLKQFNQIEYINNYNKQNYRRYAIRVKYTDEDIIKHLDSLESVNRYIIDLIKKDIEK